MQNLPTATTLLLINLKAAGTSSLHELGRRACTHGASLLLHPSASMARTASRPVMRCPAVALFAGEQAGTALVEQSFTKFLRATPTADAGGALHAYTHGRSTARHSVTASDANPCNSLGAHRVLIPLVLRTHDMLYIIGQSQHVSSLAAHAAWRASR